MKVDLSKLDRTELDYLSKKLGVVNYKKILINDLRKKIETTYSNEEILKILEPRNKSDSKKTKFSFLSIPIVALLFALVGLILNPTIQDFVLDFFVGENVGFVTIGGKQVGIESEPYLEFGNTSNRKLNNVVISEHKLGIDLKLGDVQPLGHTKMEEIKTISDTGNYYLFYISQNEEIYHQEIYLVQDKNRWAFCTRVKKWNLTSSESLELEEFQNCTYQFPFEKSKINWRLDYKEHFAK